MAVLTVTPVTQDGYDLTAALTAAAAGGDSWPNRGTEYLAVVNGGGSSITVTLVYTTEFDDETPTNRTVAVAAGKTVLIGPLPQWLYNNASNRASVTYSGVTSVTVAVFSLG
jgi:hypothetical protein